MTLQASGTITMADIVAEFGGTAPHSISEYYRGGAYVPDIPQNAAIPTSGTISFSNFYGATALDILPNSVTWENLSFAGSGTDTGLSQTITGINTTITLEVVYDGGVNMDIELLYRLNNTGGYTSLTPGSDTITVSNGTIVNFRATRPFPSGFDSSFVQINNTPNGGSAFSNFAINCT